MKRLLATSLLVVLAALALHAACTLDVYFIDVGAGDAILIDCGNWEALLDAGPGFSSSNSKILEVLEEHVDDGTIELAILSHPHSDHYGGFRAVFDRYEVGTFWRSHDTEADCHGITYDTFMTALAQESSALSLLEVGDQVSFGLLRWVVLGPNEIIGGSENDNENSLVLLATYGDVHFLFVGDIETIGESALQDIALPEGDIILKAAHHGSDTSTSLAFLTWAQPDLAVISTRYSTPPAASALESLSIPYMMTSECGTICVATDGESIWISTDTLSSFDVDCTD